MLGSVVAIAIANRLVTTPLSAVLVSAGRTVVRAKAARVHRCDGRDWARGGGWRRGGDVGHGRGKIKVVGGRGGSRVVGGEGGRYPCSQQALARQRKSQTTRYFTTQMLHHHKLRLASKDYRKNK